jgi:hypothetical protein
VWDEEGPRRLVRVDLVLETLQELVVVVFLPLVALLGRLTIPLGVLEFHVLEIEVERHQIVPMHDGKVNRAAPHRAPLVQVAAFFHQELNCPDVTLEHGPHTRGQRSFLTGPIDVRAHFQEHLDELDIAPGRRHAERRELALGADRAVDPGGVIVEPLLDLLTVALQKLPVESRFRVLDVQLGGCLAHGHWC